MDKTAKLVLSRADEAIEMGTKKHGDTKQSFEMVGVLWTTYLQHAWVERGLRSILPHDVAVMMSLLKVARATYSYSFDNYVDNAGYTALAAMLHPQTTHPGVKDETV